MDEKRINFTIDTDGNGFIGFNLRGGKEYGLGLYISKYGKLFVHELITVINPFPPRGSPLTSNIIWR